MTTRYHVVVLLLKGRKFPKRAKSFLLAEAKFDGNLVLSDPVEHLECPDFNEELAWDVDKRTLQQHKLQRSSIKIQLYCVSGSSRDLIGYVLLDLRSAGESVKENLKWHSVLNTKYFKSKPEIQMSLYIDCHNSTSNINEKSLAAKTGIGKLLNKLDSSLKPVLNPVTGIYRIGAEEADDKQMFTLTFVVALAVNLVQLVPLHAALDTSFGFFFYFSLLGAEVTTQVFHDIVDPDFEAEQFSVKISSTLEKLRTYFEYQTLEINFCCRGQILGSCQFPLGDLASSDLHEEPATIEGVYQIFPSKSSSQSRSTKVIPDELKPVIGASVTLKMLKPPAETGEESVVSTQNVANESRDVEVSNQVLKGILKKKLNGLNGRASSDNGKEVEGHLPSHPVEDEAAVLEERQGIIGDNNRKSLFINPSKSSKEVPVKDFSAETLSISNPNRSNSQSQMSIKDHHLEDVDQTPHHFCFSIDLINIYHFKNAKPLHIFLKYFYEFFRSGEETMTDAVEVSENSEAMLPNSLCYFDFATDRKHLEDSLKSKPLLVEVWSLNIGQSSSSCIGVVKVDLSKVFQPKEGGDNSSSMEGHWSGKLPVLSTERDSRQIGILQVHLSFVDRGPVDVDNVISARQVQSRLTDKEVEKQVSSKTIDVRDTSEYKAAMELELWKKERMEELQAEMEEMKVRLEKDLENNFKKKDRERALLVSAEMEKYEKLNAELKKSLSDIEKREKLLVCNESELERRSLEMEREHERKMMDLREASKRSQDTCNHLIDMERKKLEAAEETIDKLKKQLSEGELRYQRLLKDFDNHREKSKPETDFQAENNILIREKFNLEKQLEAANRDAKLYKEQWMRALTVVQKFKERDAVMDKMALKRQQEEMEMLKMERVMKGEKEASDKLRLELDDVTKELRRFKEEQIIRKKSPIKRRSAKANYFSEEEDDDDDALNINGSRGNDKDDLDDQISSEHMVKEKNLLLRTGLYTEQDLRRLY